MSVLLAGITVVLSLYYADVLSENDRIEFHGQVVDVDGNPVEDIEVRANVRRTSRLSLVMPVGGSASTVVVESTTGDDGKFVILGHGVTLTIDAWSDGAKVLVPADGDKLALIAYPRAVGQFVPHDPGDPVVLVLQE